MMFIAVDLPEPDGPMMATNSPSSIARSTPAERMHGRLRRCRRPWLTARNSISGGLET